MKQRGRPRKNQMIERPDLHLNGTLRADTPEDIISWVPTKDPLFVPFGGYDELKSIIESAQFFPVWIAGLSGNGKTAMVEQCCAELEREYIRIPITSETDEDELLGGFRLIDGKTVFFKGPIILAMERGAVANLDEIDKATDKIMCLQPILEGKPVLLKRINELVYPAPGFTVVATANTKGQGSEDGKFVTSRVLDEAFLERFLWTIHQQFPDKATEKKILIRVLDHYGVKDDKFADNLSQWGEVIRKTFDEGACDEVIATRRLVGVCRAYAIFGSSSKLRSITGCLKRFDDVNRNAFLDLYKNIDDTLDNPVADPGPTAPPKQKFGAANDSDLTPF